ncbi:amino acid adenylation domain-containing protein [Leptobacterium flavescens]|uniref:Amino acid adenylation domain-containing protein n=1 Tax=Leptobacterium flavescens TaxID=472055 RepID=A0A6P0UKC1_9FLAO|nr:non-ribosomal peptide synthetase [Leptobacterium flavescens]NER13674.1 amino acid adenylation domain-containing protein [Leptobacterium flavescens]
MKPETINKEKLLPLTQSQLLMWAGQKLYPDAPFYNMAHSFDIEGRINTDIFQKAFAELIVSCDALRTVFREENGLPGQYILAEVPFELPLMDFSGKDEQSIRQWLQERSEQIFDLDRPLFDSVLIKAGEERFIWFLNLHHLVTDATSSTILYEAMNKLYTSFLEGNEEDRAAEVFSFEDYIRFETGQEEKNTENIAYWKEKIKVLRSEPKLYGNNKTVKTSRTDRVSVSLGKERTEKLKTLIAQPEVRSWTQDLSLFTVFTTTLFAFLYRVSGQKTLAIGTPSHNRPTKKFKQTPGVFIELYPLIAGIEDNDSFLSLLQKIKTETNDYLRHAQPGCSSAETGRSFNVVLNYINASFSDFNGYPMNSEWIHPSHCDPMHHLRCHVQDMDASGIIELQFDLNKDVFNKDQIQAVPGHFLQLLDAFIADMETPLSKPVLLTDKEISSYFTEDIKTENKIKPLIERFEENAAAYPDRTALVFKGESITFEELNNRSNQLARYLKDQGADDGKTIAVYLRRSPDYIISLLAILKAGGNYVPIPSDYPLKRIDFILEESNASVLISHSELADKLNEREVPLLCLDKEQEKILKEGTENLKLEADPEALAYTIYTSGSTGKPKGVMISHKALDSYINWAAEYYHTGEAFNFPLFTSIGFDLTVTSTFLPLISGGKLLIYGEAVSGPDMSLLNVLEDNQVNSIKLTPSHLSLIAGTKFSDSGIRTMIVGGEDFKTSLAATIAEAFDNKIRIYNEYGPTEATVGCVVHNFDPEKDKEEASVPIGKAIPGMQALILDEYLQPVPQGVIGELYLGGSGLANGYANRPELSRERFIEHPQLPGERLYVTGDLARSDGKGNLHYLGRKDEQVKLGGIRIELAEIEANISELENIDESVVVMIDKKKGADEEVKNCTECGLPSNFPSVDFNEEGVCHLCTTFKGYEEKTKKYFKDPKELKEILTTSTENNPEYDCLTLLSGGKDSTYVLAKLMDMGLRVLAFTLDNGYISDQAKANIDRVVTQLGVDHIYGDTPAMNEIFVDSLHRHKNVCNGCFKTIYTLSTRIALEKKIPYIVTGLSRGQFFETRLTEELFWDEDVDIREIDNTILEARKIYHREEDAVCKLLDVSMFENDNVFEKVQFLDFYRYNDVSLEEMLRYLKEKISWVRPTDTGRSTNCLINQVGIYVHKKEMGYSNYAFPYSWDVRMGHKTREEALDEIDEPIEEKEVFRIMEEIGYKLPEESSSDSNKLIAYYTGDEKRSSSELRQELGKSLPGYMIPVHFKHMEALPLTPNGKIDRMALQDLNDAQLSMDTPYVAPQTEIEEIMAEIWAEVLKMDKVGIHDDFIALGGHSLAAIRVTARMNEAFEMDFALNTVFEYPTIAEFSKHIENTIMELL